MIRSLHSIRRWWKHESPVTVELPVNGNGKSNGHATIPAVDPPWVPHLERAGIPRSLVYPTTTLGRVLDLFDIDNAAVSRWGGLNSIKNGGE